MDDHPQSDWTLKFGVHIWCVGRVRRASSLPRQVLCEAADEAVHAGGHGQVPRAARERGDGLGPSEHRELVRKLVTRDGTQRHRRPGLGCAAGEVAGAFFEDSDRAGGRLDTCACICAQGDGVGELLGAAVPAAEAASQDADGPARPRARSPRVASYLALKQLVGPSAPESGGLGDALQLETCPAYAGAARGSTAGRR